MQLQSSLFKGSILALASLASVVEGFRDTSPFFLFSTRDLPFPSSSIRSAHSLSPALTDTLSTCPSDYYILVSQPGVHASDFTAKRPLMPRLKERLTKEDGVVKSSAVVDEVVYATDKGRMSGLGVTGPQKGSLRRILEEKCGAKTVLVDGMSGVLPPSHTYGQRPLIIELDFKAPLADGRADQLETNDAVLASLIELLPSTDYTVVMSTTPVDPSIPFPLHDENSHPHMTGHKHAFEHFQGEGYPGSPSPLKVQARRDVSSHQDGNLGKKANQSEGGVFERYQFLSQGIFMGLFAVIIFAIVIFVAVSAVLSIEISYGSFAKDTSPVKKTQ
ncbi:hypothetical protein KEM55_003214 [Ascosphaera atra]|nr:hypothetical protein KEM55_003214 [Ascosphaera atra]